MDMRRRIIIKRRLRDVQKLTPVFVGVAIGAGGFFLIDRAIEKANARRPPAAAVASTPHLSFATCDAARAAGRAPLHRGQPGYNRRLDTDRDGVACEPVPR